MRRFSVHPVNPQRRLLQQAADALRSGALVTEFREVGGQGIEVLSSSHDPADVSRFAQWSREFGLAASRGSDFHDPVESTYDLGKLPLLPDGLVPVWADWPEFAKLN